MARKDPRPQQAQEPDQESLGQADMPALLTGAHQEQWIAEQWKGKSQTSRRRARKGRCQDLAQTPSPQVRDLEPFRISSERACLKERKA